MSAYWLKYTLHLSKAVEDEFTQVILESNYTLGWIEPAVEVVVTANGYDYQENTDAPLTAYLFEPLQKAEDEHVQELSAFLHRWQGGVSLLATERVEEENDSWKEAYKPVEVGDWVIAPSWVTDEELPVKKQVLRIDPGAAFGTGYHGTTQDIIALLGDMPLSGTRVVDIGAGSGILSIFCLLRGAARPICAIDINPDFQWQMEHNLALNDLPLSSARLFVQDASDSTHTVETDGLADLVLVNIGGDEDIAVLPFVKQVLKVQGTAMISGMVEWNEEQVQSAFEQEGFAVEKRKQSDEWITLLLRRLR